jgi:hypothetical protein
MALLGELLDAMVRAARFPHRDQRLAGELRRARCAWDAWDAALRDAALDGARFLLAPLDAMCAGKLAGRAQGVPAPAWELLPLRRLRVTAKALCKRGAGRSAA